MKRFDLVLTNTTGSSERIGSIEAFDLQTAQSYLVEKWMREHPDGRTPSMVCIPKPAHTAIICFGSHELHIIDTHAEAIERDGLVRYFAGDHIAETS